MPTMEPQETKNVSLARRFRLIQVIPICILDTGKFFR